MAGHRPSRPGHHAQAAGGVQMTTRMTARPRGRDADRSREAILDAAEGMFAERGFDGASLASISDAANVSAALPAYFFGSKRDLYRAVIERLFSDRNQTLE